MEADIRKVVRQVIRQELASIMMGMVVSNDNKERVSVKRFNNEPPTDNVRHLHPFGLASRMKPGTQTLILPLDGNPTNMTIMGAFDPNRPSVEDGEAALYGADGQVILMKNGGTIHQGSAGASSPVVLGDVLKDFVQELIQAFSNSTSITISPSDGPLPLNPAIVTALQELLMRLNDPDENFLGQKNFVQRS